MCLGRILEVPVESVAPVVTMSPPLSKGGFGIMERSAISRSRPSGKLGGLLARSAGHLLHWLNGHGENVSLNVGR